MIVRIITVIAIEHCGHQWPELRVDITIGLQQTVTLIDSNMALTIKQPNAFYSIETKSK